MHNYVIITPAYNEETNLYRLYKSIKNQSIDPICWIIVNDDSTDNTGQIIDQLSKKESFIHGIHKCNDFNSHNYAKKVHAFNEGYDYLKKSEVPWDYIANIDADITLPSNYFETIINQFKTNQRVGIVGGMYKYHDETIISSWSGDFVPGSALVTKRQCFEEIDGYKPLKFGAEDTLLCIMAEHNNWRVSHIKDLIYTQHREVGTAANNIITVRFQQGKADYCIGYHPLFEIAKSIKRLFIEKPIIIGSLSRIFGYCFAFIYEKREYIDPNLIDSLHKIQLKRIKFSILKRQSR